MKSVVALGLIFLCFARTVRGDLVVQQQLESATASGLVTLKFKGNLARIDMPSAIGGTASIIMNLDTDEVANLIHEQKLAYIGKLSAQRLKSETVMKQSGIDVAALKPAPTGKKEKIGEWDAEEYTLDVAGLKFRIWVAPNFP